MMAVDISTQPAFTAGKPRVLFEDARHERISNTPDYDVSLDGQRFLMVQAGEQQSATQLNVVLKANMLSRRPLIVTCGDGVK